VPDIKTARQSAGCFLYLRIYVPATPYFSFVFLENFVVVNTETVLIYFLHVWENKGSVSEKDLP